MDNKDTAAKRHWKMEYCKAHKLPAAYSWAWTRAEKAYNECLILEYGDIKTENKDMHHICYTCNQDCSACLWALTRHQEFRLRDCLLDFRSLVICLLLMILFIIGIWH